MENKSIKDINKNSISDNKPVLSRKVCLKTLTYIDCGKDSEREGLLLAEKEPYYDNINEAQDKLTVAFTDPEIFASTIFINVWLKLKVDFVKKIKENGPKFYEDKTRNYDNCAWLMGELYDFDTYQYAGTITNDISIGAILVNTIPKEKRCFLSWFDEELQNVTDIITNQSNMPTSHPSILWASENRAHGVGAFVFYHEDSTGEIDSVIIDNCYFDYPENIPNETFLLHDDGNIKFVPFEQKSKKGKKKGNKI